MTKKISSAEAKAKLSALVTEAAFGGQRIVIEKRGKALAAIIGIGELKYLEQGHTPSPHPKGALAIVGAWKDVSEKKLDKLVSQIYKDRLKDTGRSVRLEA